MVRGKVVYRCTACLISSMPIALTWPNKMWNVPHADTISVHMIIKNHGLPNVYTSIFNLHAHAALQTHTDIIHINSKTYADTIPVPLTFSVHISPNYLHTDISLQYQTQKKASFMDIHGYGYFQKKLWILQDGPKISKTTYKWAKKTPHSTYILSPATHLLGHLGRGPPFAPKLPIGFHHTALQPNASGREMMFQAWLSVFFVRRKRCLLVC